jgi:hypothetical protein
MSSRKSECMKKARLKVVGVKSPEKRRVSTAFLISWTSEYAAVRDRVRMSARGGGSASLSPVGCWRRAAWIFEATSASRPSWNRSRPVSISKSVAPTEKRSEAAEPSPPEACSGAR